MQQCCLAKGHRSTLLPAVIRLLAEGCGTTIKTDLPPSSKTRPDGRGAFARQRARLYDQSMSNDVGTPLCIGCGARVPDGEGPAHRYVGASPGCWAILNEVQMRGYDDAAFAIGQLGVDAYMAQHPGTPSPQSIQSVTVHLIGLCLQLEYALSGERSRKAMVQAECHKQEFRWLSPPAAPGALTIVDVRDTWDRALFSSIVRRWAEAVWEAWSPHHDAVRAWVARLGYTL
jgi:hypothetical protein